MEISNDQTSAIDTKKIQLIQMIAQVYNQEILLKVEELLLSSKADWWNNISNSEKNAILEGLEDYKNNRLFTHEEVMAQVRERIKK